MGLSAVKRSSQGVIQLCAQQGFGKLTFPGTGCFRNCSGKGGNMAFPILCTELDRKTAPQHGVHGNRHALRFFCSILKSLRRRDASGPDGLVVCQQRILGNAVEIRVADPFRDIAAE